MLLANATAYKSSYSIYCTQPSIYKESAMNSVELFPHQHLMHSPFEGHEKGEFKSSQCQVNVSLNAGFVSSLTLLGTWNGAGAQLTQKISAMLGLDAPAKTGDVVYLANPVQPSVLMRVGPEELWLLEAKSGDQSSYWRAQLPADAATITDLSHARCVIRVKSQNANFELCQMLNKLYALDFRLSHFPIGQVKHTGHHHVPVLLHRLSEQEFDVYAMTTYAYETLHNLYDAALEYGVNVEY